jgi:hypothetical protein
MYYLTQPSLPCYSSPLLLRWRETEELAADAWGLSLVAKFKSSSRYRVSRAEIQDPHS